MISLWEEGGTGVRQWDAAVVVCRCCWPFICCIMDDGCCTWKLRYPWGFQFINDSSILGVAGGICGFSLLIVNVSTCAWFDMRDEAWRQTEDCLFFVSCPDSGSHCSIVSSWLMFVQGLVGPAWPVEGGRERDESLIWDGGMNLRGRIFPEGRTCCRSTSGSVSWIGPALRFSWQAG